MVWCQCELPEYSQFFGTMAGVCVNTTEEMIAETLAFISLATWVCASVPQYWSNYQHKHVDAIAPLLFIIRGIGDVLMLFGTILQGASIPIQAISAFFIFDDIFMLGQLYYYTYVYKHKLPTSMPMSSAGRSNKTATMMAMAIISTGALAANTMLIPASNTYSRTLLGQPDVKFCDDFGRTEFQKEIGNIFIWLGGVIYFVSRIPQVYKNWKNKHCDGLSMGMFLMFAVANITYGASFIVKEAKENTSFSTFMSTRFNFLLGSCGVLLFDILIVIQGKLYKKK